jgi:hypothetical protein
VAFNISTALIAGSTYHPIFVVQLARLGLGNVSANHFSAVQLQ